jgi:hypothetical protein
VVWLQAHKDHIRHLWRLQHYSMEKGQDTALGIGAVDDWEICTALGLALRHDGGHPKPGTQALMNGAIKVCR